MEYRYCEDENFEDFASGRVLYSVPGVPNFPVRLGNEIFRRGLSYCKKKKEVTIYDPCSGGGYLLTVLSFCNSCITRAIASDINEKMIETATRNLGLLSQEGLTAREKQIMLNLEEYHKQSHEEALSSIQKLKKLRNSIQCETQAFTADVTDPFLSRKYYDISEEAPDIIITDIPYGNLVTWEQESEQESDPSQTDFTNAMCDHLASVARENTILVVISDKKQKICSQPWHRLHKQQIGKRKFEIFSYQP